MYLTDYMKGIVGLHVYPKSLACIYKFMGIFTG